MEGRAIKEGRVAHGVRGRARRPYANCDLAYARMAEQFTQPSMSAMLHRLCDSCMAQRNLGRSRSFSSPRAPATLAPRRSRVRLAASPGLVRYRIPAGAFKHKGAEFRPAPPGPARRAALRPGQAPGSIQQGGGYAVSVRRAVVWPLLRADGAMPAHGCRGVVTTSITASRDHHVTNDAMPSSAVPIERSFGVYSTGLHRGVPDPMALRRSLRYLGRANLDTSSN